MYERWVSKLRGDLKAMSKQNEGIVSIEVDGQQYTGQWKEDRGLVTVSFPGAPPEARQVGSSHPPYKELTESMLYPMVLKLLARKKR
jgi:hypothetical protein